MTFSQAVEGGAVFCAGSSALVEMLPQCDYDNDFSRIAGNVLQRFRDPAPF
jgi:hypothetical protein